MGLWFGDDPKDNYNGLDSQVPDPSKSAYTPGQAKAGSYKAQQIGPNALAGADGDGAARSAQRQALMRLQQSAQGGLNDADKAGLNSALGKAAQVNRGQQGAILQGAQSRGALNSGATLAAQLQAQQGAQEAGANAAVDVAGQAAQRAQEANAQAAVLGGQMDQSAFQRQAITGQAQNEINARNAAAGNDSARFNAELQALTDRFNIGNDIGAKQFLAQLLQQKFANELGVANGKASADAANNAANMQLLSGIIGAAGNLGGTLLMPGGALGPKLAQTVLNRAHGGHVPGKAKVEGDSLKNDTVPAMLSPGEIVIPRTAAQSFDKAVKFLEKEMGNHFDSAVSRSKK